MLAEFEYELEDEFVDPFRRLNGRAHILELEEEAETAPFLESSIAEWEGSRVRPRTIQLTISGFSRYSTSLTSLPVTEQAKLRQLARLIIASYRPGSRPINSVSLIGHADSDPQRGPAFEKRISGARALAIEKAVQNLINNLTISSKIRWRAIAKGATQPVIRKPTTESQRRRNRRVMVILTSAASPVPPSPRPSPRPTPATTDNVSPSFVRSVTPVVFRKSADINDYYQLTARADFVDWFNTNIAGRSHWAPIHIGRPGDAPAVKTRFNRIWDRIPELFNMASINLLQFLSLMSILLNETGGSLLPVSEHVGRPGHPGIAYAFNRIPNVKASYNVGGGNRTALDLFRDPRFLAAHGHLPQTNQVKDTNDARWAGTRYPQEDFPTSTDPAISGIIIEADFYKFRGRGLIQTTFRPAYQQIIRYVLDNQVDHPIIDTYRRRWANLSSETIATTSTNEDWDRLFQQTDFIIPTIAVRLHSQGSGHYLIMPLDADILNSKERGSIWNVGRRVGGSSKYADLFRARVLQILNAMGNTPPTSP
jgi:outer membrane protein OmpA-like peptidoglycan-associated protein